ncbi:MAG: bifunctional rhamnulose-1-phosphate aldolase/short-chain dehydrogenase, partial [Chloroflexota bacterium]
MNRGGGNTSVKRRVVDFRGREVDVLTVKGTGYDLRTITGRGFADVVMEDILPLRAHNAMTDEAMVEYLSHCMIDPTAPRPSIETLLHGFLPAKHIDHTHADISGAIATSVRGEEIARRLFGKEMVWVPYIRPGFTMAKMTVDALDANPAARFVVLQKHGLITWADDARECYRRNVEFLDRGAAFVADEAKGKRVFGGLKVGPATETARARLAAAVMPALRGELSRNQRVVLHFDNAPDILEFVSSAEGQSLAEAGLACPDHVLYTKVKPMWASAGAEAGAEGIVAAVRRDLAAYVEAYGRFFEANKESWDTPAEPLPKIVLTPGLGMITAGKDKRAATITADFYHRAIAIMRGATGIDRFLSLTAKEAYDIEYWPLELYKLTLLPPEKELSRRVAFITGGAGALGRAIAERFVQEGCHVALADINHEGAAAIAEDLVARYGQGMAAAVHADVTSEASIRAALAATVRTYGGLDVLVCNAGVASSHSIEDTTLEEWQRTMDVLSTGYFLTAREGVKLMRQQRTPDGRPLGGSVIFV